VALLHTVSRVDTTAHVVLAGEVDLSTADELRDVLFDTLARRPRAVAVDLRGLVFLDSSGISALVAARHAAVAHGAALYVTEPRGQVLRVLSISGVLPTLTEADPARTGAAGGAAADCA
jgi:anti-sigma B factor antagonist